MLQVCAVDSRQPTRTQHQQMVVRSAVASSALPWTLSLCTACARARWTCGRQAGSRTGGPQPAPSACALVSQSRTSCAARVQLALGTQGDDSKQWRVCRGKVRYDYPCAAVCASGMARRGPLPPATRAMPLPPRGCASRAPVAAGARLTRANVCLAYCWNHLAAVDTAHGMLHK